MSDVGRELRCLESLTLSELVKDPHRSTRALSEVISEEYEWEISPATIGRLIREMREAGMFREVVIPNIDNLAMSMFEFKINLDNYQSDWWPAVEYIRNSDNTLMLFSSNGTYQLKGVMVFQKPDDDLEWSKELYEEHGRAFIDIRIATIPKVFEFGISPELIKSTM